MSGIQRTATVNSRRLLGWAHVPDLGNRSGPKLHGMQGVRADVEVQVLHGTRQR